MRPRILIFINTLDIGGSERVVSLLLQNLYKDFEIHLAVYSKVIRYEIPEDIKILDLEQPLKETKAAIFLKAPFIAWRVAKYCRQHAIETTVSFLYRPCFVTALMKTYFGFKGYVIMCERTHQTAILKSYGFVLNKITRAIIRFAYQHADLVLTNSYVMQQDLVKNLKIKTPSRVIYNPVDIDYIKSQSTEAPDITFEEGTFYFISVGGFRAEKNQMLLIEAFFILRKLKCKLIFVGGGAGEEKCRQKVKELEIEDKVIFCGFNQNPFKYVMRSDCFVLTSNLEGFPNVLLEALACGKAIISTDCTSGPRELLAPDTDIHQQAINHYEVCEFGILSPVNDISILSLAMKRMYEDTALRKSYEAKAQERVAAFNVNDIKQYFHVAFSSG